MSKNIISPILLAAGRSQRFGSDKLIHLITIEGQTQALIIHTLQTWLTVFKQVSVVVHTENTPLSDVIRNSPFNSQINLIFVDGKNRSMSASLIAGISATDTANAWLIGLADMPFVQSSVIQNSFDALTNGAEITLPVFEQQLGHPVGFKSIFRDRLIALSGDQGAKKIIQSSLQSVIYINSTDKGILIDVDTKEDLNDITSS